VLHYDAANAIMAMQFLAPPFTILRHAMCAGASYPCVPQHAAEFCAATLFGTSLLALDSAAFRQQVARFTNTELCRWELGRLPPRHSPAPHPRPPLRPPPRRPKPSSPPPFPPHLTG
jgi:hypothetical protein